MTSRFRRIGLAAAIPVLALSGVVCAGKARPLGPGEARGAVPELRGQKVMVLPFQIRQGVAGDPDAELAFALGSSAEGVEWILPEALREALRTSPALDAPLTGLPVEAFLRTEVERLGDPVFGILRRLGALTGADFALLPVAIATHPAAGSEPARVQASAALLSVRTGWVLWYGVVAGPGTGSDPAALAAAMDALGRRLAPRATAGDAPDPSAGR
jgi:hypothetical protein